MKVLCKDRHYRKFKWGVVNRFYDFFQCKHCPEFITVATMHSCEDAIEKLTAHTCKARLKELKK